jgi:hypothetical protein
MPITIDQPTTITIDKIKINNFSVSTQGNQITIHFSKGYETPEGEFVSKEFDRVDIKNATVDPLLYSQVKDALYALLIDELEKRKLEQQK